MKDYFLRWLYINAAAGLRRTSIFGRCIVQFCLCAPVVFTPVMSHPPNTKPLQGMGTSVDLCCLSWLKGYSWCLVFPFHLLLSWLRAGLLLAGRRREVVWEQLLADRIHELVIKRSPGTFFCSPQSRLLSRSLLLVFVIILTPSSLGKGVPLDCFYLKKGKKLKYLIRRER